MGLRTDGPPCLAGGDAHDPDPCRLADAGLPGPDLDLGARDGVHDLADASTSADGGNFGPLDVQYEVVLHPVDENVIDQLPAASLGQAQRFDIAPLRLSPLAVAEGVELGQLHRFPRSDP